jgi:hypothetical protein
MTANLQYTLFKNRSELTGQGVISSLDDLTLDIACPSTHKSKDTLPAFMPYKLKDDLRSDTKAGFKQAVEGCSAIVIDYDQGLMPMSEAVEKMEEHKLSAMFYTTASYTPDKPRYRIILPTTNPIDVKLKRELTGQVNTILGGVLGSDSFDVRLLYFGKVEGVEYDYRFTQGDNIDVAESLIMWGIDQTYPEGLKAANDATITPLDDFDKAVLHTLPDDQLPTLINCLEFLAGKGVADYYPTLSLVGLGLKGSCDDEQGFGLFDKYFCTLSPRYDKEGLRDCWNNITGSNTGYKNILKIASEQYGWINPAKGKTPLPAELKLSPLGSYSLRGQSKQMKEALLAERHVLKGIALRGDITIIYAEPNAGKTLITLKLLTEAIASGDIKGQDVYYLNADDNARGLQMKVELCEKYGFEMLSPGHNGFKAEFALPIMQGMIIDDTASGKIIILDTAKKFTDLMDKKASSGFMVLVREFALKGGTVICLAHVNKSKDAEGKAVHAGTTDLKDDSDATYRLEVNGTIEGVKSVTFTRDKARGGNEGEITFTYPNADGSDYMDIFNSVKRANNVDAGKFKKAGAKAKRLENDMPVIAAIGTVLNESGTMIKGALIKAVLDSGVTTKRALLGCLREYDGTKLATWVVDRGCKTEMLYRPLPDGIDQFGDDDLRN